jgi:hypothetical protein
MPFIWFTIFDTKEKLSNEVKKLYENKKYKKNFENNKNAIKDIINQSPFYQIIKNKQNFIKGVLFLALKTILEDSKRKKGFFEKIKSYFLQSNNFVDQFYKLVSDNSLIQAITINDEYKKDIRNK